MTTMNLTGVDTAWLMMETPDTPLHVGVLAIFRKPASAAEDYISRLAGHFAADTGIVAPWNYHLANPRRHSVSPHLIEDPDVELDYHFRRWALPQPGDERELGRMVSRLHSGALDLTRPLWEYHIIEGLERGRFAVYLKVHHALVGDVNALPLLFGHLSARSSRRLPRPLWCYPLPVANEAERGFGPGTLLALGSAGIEMLRNFLSRRAPGKLTIPLRAPRSTLNRRINHRRRVATQQFETARINALAEATDSTPNELLTYLCGSALRRFFKEYNALPDESLVGVMPVSLQENSEQSPGNAIAGIRVELGTHIGDPLARLEAVKVAIARVRAERASLPRDAVVPYTLLRAAPLLASQLPLVGGIFPVLFNLGVSGTSGPDSMRYLGDARLDAVYPLGYLLQYVALSIDCVSYAGTFNISFTGARDTLPHLQRMAVYFGRAVADLEEIVMAEGGVQ